MVRTYLWFVPVQPCFGGLLAGIPRSHEENGRVVHARVGKPAQWTWLRGHTVLPGMVRLKRDFFNLHLTFV